jgi:hypothetical protein
MTNISSSVPQTHNFAKYFSQVDFLDNPVTRQVYKTLICYWEGKFISPDIGYHPISCITYDGYNYLRKKKRRWTAPSKESLHLGLIACALNGNRLSQLALISHKMDTINQVDDKHKLDTVIPTCLHVLECKFAEYERYSSENEGCGGFLPWVKLDSENGTMSPINEKVYLPALDNGQFAWSIIAVLQSLRKMDQTTQVQQLTSICERIMNRLIRSAQIIFVDHNIIRERTLVLNPKGAVSPENYTTATYIIEEDHRVLEKPSILSDPYEGELMIMFLDLCCDWAKSNNVCDLYWNDQKRYVRDFIAKFPLEQEEKITVERGSFFSSHEQWKVMVLPYLTNEKYATLFKNNEIARTHHSVNRDYRGLFATANVFCENNSEKEEHVLCYGIDSLSHHGNIKNMMNHALKGDLFAAPYASFPLFMVDDTRAIAWYHSMVSVPDMQTEYGSLESFRINNEQVHDAMTWDGKITTVLAMCGGTCDILEQWMKENNKLEMFNKRLQSRFDAIEIMTSDTVIALPEEQHHDTLLEFYSHDSMRDARSLYQVVLEQQGSFFKVKPSKLQPSTLAVKDRSDATLFDVVFVAIDVVYIRMCDTDSVLSVLGDGRITLREKKCGWNELFVVKQFDQVMSFQGRLGYLHFTKCAAIEQMLTCTWLQ